MFKRTKTLYWRFSFQNSNKNTIFKVMTPVNTFGWRRVWVGSKSKKTVRLLLPRYPNFIFSMLESCFISPCYMSTTAMLKQVKSCRDSQSWNGWNYITDYRVQIHKIMSRTCRWPQCLNAWNHVTDMSTTKCYQ